MKTNIHQFREELKQKFEEWRKTGHDITYEQWLEIKLAVEIENCDYMIEVYRGRLTELERRLYDMTSLRDWQLAGYDSAEYDALYAKFESEEESEAE